MRIRLAYDNIGNPTKWYDDTVFAWVNGRRLATAVNSTTGLNNSYTYDADGLRLTKTVGGVEHRYTWQGGKLISETWGGKKIEFFYGPEGSIDGFNYKAGPNSSVYVYYYVKNLQGDVVAIINKDGELRAEYTYDPFGKVLSATGTMADINPIRYRGYYYDQELGFYYLQSRYYDPNICRFINSDGLASTGQGFLGCNMFAYCNNNPVVSSDGSGCRPVCEEIEGPHVINGQDIDPYSDIKYGISTIGFSGCEVVAIYNALLLIGKYKSFSRIKSFVELLLSRDGGYGQRGLFGADRYDIMSTLDHFDVSYVKLTYEDLFSVEDGSVMIVGFWTKTTILGFIRVPSIHTVAIKYDGEHYNVYNRYSDSRDTYRYTNADFFGGEEKYIYGFKVN